MKATHVVSILLIIATTLAAQRPAPPRTVADIDLLLAKIAKFEHGQSREPLGQFMELVFNSMGSQAQLRQIEARLLKFIESGTTPAARDFALDQLTFIATESSVPALGTLLTRPETAEQARFLLERIPGQAANEALRKALDTASGNAKIGIINSLGRRRDTRSVASIAALITPADKALTKAALAALAGIADPAAVKALATARNKLENTLREDASEAYAECADQLAKRRDRNMAVRMYRELLNAREAAGVRIRAMAGLVALEGKNAIPALATAMHSKDRREQSAAITFLNRIPEAESTKVMMEEFPKLNAAGQVRILAALADRDDASAKPLVLAAVKSNSGDVRTAAFSALAKLGNESDVLALAHAAAERPGPEQEAARQSLWTVRGAKADLAIVEAIRSEHGKVRAELILAAGERGTTSAAGEISKALQDADPDVQRAALRALRNAGGPAQLGLVLDLLTKASGASDRREATQTLVAVVKRSGPATIRQVLSAYRAAPSTESRLSLLEVMGHSSNDAALPLLRSSLHDANPEIARGAILAISNWEKPAALPDLYAIAKNGKDPTLKTLALRGFIKLIGLRSTRPASDTIRLIGEALQLSKDTAEKRSVLALLPAYPSEQSLQLAETLLRDESVANEAKAAVTRLRSAIGQQ